MNWPLIDWITSHQFSLSEINPRVLILDLKMFSFIFIILLLRHVSSVVDVLQDTQTHGTCRVDTVRMHRMRIEFTTPWFENQLGWPLS